MAPRLPELVHRGPILGRAVHTIYQLPYAAKVAWSPSGRQTNETALALALALALIASAGAGVGVKIVSKVPGAESGAGPLARRSANQTRLHRRRQTETERRAVPDCDNGFFGWVVQRQTVLFPFPFCGMGNESRANTVE